MQTSIYATFCSGAKTFSYDLFNYIQNTLGLGGHLQDFNECGSKWQLSFCTNDAKVLMHYMYKDSNVFLDRKYALYQKLIVNNDRKKRDKGIVHPLSNKGLWCLYGSGPQKVSDTVSKATGEYYGLDRAKEDIKAYFTKFSKLKSWLKSREEFIRANGFTYSFFGRKRRLVNVFSTDKGIAAHEVRSGINSEVQSICSDVNLLGAIDTANELKAKNIDAKIFALVHDSIVAVVKDEYVDTYCEIVKRNTQKDRGCSIKGSPIGVDQEVGQDYGFGKFDKYYTNTGDYLSRISTSW